jgi:hypothetical protein
VPTKQAKQIKQPKTTETPQVDETLAMVVKDFKSSWDYCAGSWHDRWMNNYKLYNNERVKVGYNGITDTFVPMVFGTIETLCSALFGSKPKFNYLAPKENKDQKTDILNALLDFYWEKDQWSIKVINTGRGMLREGTAVDYFCWVGDHPVLINVPIRDFFIDPTATTLDNARFMGRRYLTTLDELKSFEIVDVANPIETPSETNPNETEINYGMKKKYKNLDKLDKASQDTGKGATSEEKTDKQEKDDLYGSTLEDVEGQVEVIEYWTNDEVISVMNRSIVIEESENYYLSKAKANGDPFPQGLMPFADARDYVDASLFYAKGEIDFIADEQELLNDITNQRIDAVTYVLNPMYTLDPKYADKLEQVESVPGAVYPFERDTLNRIDMGTIPPDSFNESMNIKNEIRETTASNEVVKGVGEVAGGKATATEINAQIAGAGQRINLKITQIENGYFHRVAKIVLAMVKLYVTEPMMVRIVGKDGAKWEEFNPIDFSVGDYEPRVQLDIRIENQKEQAAGNAKEMMAAFLNDPDVNQQELKKLVLAKGFDMEPDEVDLLMTPMQPPMGMDGMPMPGDAIAAGAVPTPSPAAMMPPADPQLPTPTHGPIPPQGDVIQDPETGEVINLADLIPQGAGV